MLKSFGIGTWNKKTKIMNNKIIWLLIIILLILLSVKYTHIRYKYKESLKQYHFFNDGVFNEYCDVWDYYFYENFQYPATKQELEEFYKMTEVDYIPTLKYIFKDPFSHNNSDLLYLPLYSRISKMREGFAIISTGIDGEIDAIIKDTMYIDEVKQLEFYNDSNDPASSSILLTDNIFKIDDYFFGRKDFLLCYKDGVSQYLNNNRHWSLLGFYKMIANIKRIKDQRITFVLTGKVDEIKEDYIVVKEDSITANCYMYKGRKYSVMPGDSINLVSFFRGKYDPKYRIIKLEDCILK